MFTTPKIEFKMPPAMTTLHNGRPRFCTLVAALLRLPSILKPRTSIDEPRKRKPDFSLSSGQYVLKYDFNIESSETTRNMAMTNVMK